MRVDGRASLSEVVADLERQFGQADLEADVSQFVEFGGSRGWIEATA